MPDPGPAPDAPEDTADLERWLADRLETVRDRTLALVAPLTDEQWTTQPEPVMGVIGWDVGHIGFFEHLWLVDELGGPTLDEAETRLYDPFEHPRSERGEVELPSRDELQSFLRRVRKRALDTLHETDLAADAPRTQHGFVHDMIVRHEQQHQENMLITLQMFGDAEPPPAGAEPPVRVPEAYHPEIREPKPDPQAEVDGMVEVPGGTFPLGVDPQVGTYDNEWPAHEVTVEPFWIDETPVTNAEFRRFIEDGGYDTEEHWSTDGWMIRQALDLEHPKYWVNTDDGWWIREADRLVPLPEAQPVMCVSYYEAEAYADWAGKRLPTEAEWEMAAAVDPDSGAKARFPWGDEPWTSELANLGQRAFGPAPVGAYPEGTSPVGCHQMVGDVWEWTSTVFTGYPGFEAFPYPEYSKVHFDSGYQVLRGGSWATWPDCAHATFRNWHQPDHQHILAGFRCVQETPP